MKFYISAMYLFAIMMAINSSMVASVIGIPLLLRLFLSVGLLMISFVMIYCVEGVREIKIKMEIERRVNEIKTRIG
jgi:hypothetical protein